MANEFKIGTTLLGMNLLSALVAVPETEIPMPDSSFSLYSGAVDLADGLQRGLGKSTAVWHWEALTHTQREALKAYCSGLCADIFIRTLDEDNEYADYSGFMIWPAMENIDAAGSVLDFTISFVQLVRQ